MKQIKSIIVSCFAIICVALFGSVFTSCSNDDDLLLAGDSQTEQVLSLDQDSVKAVTRGVSSSLYDDGTYDSFLGPKYTKYQAVHVSHDRYTFKVTTSYYLTYQIYVKLYSHKTGNTTFVELPLVSTTGGVRTYQLTKQFITPGYFSYRYMVRKNSLLDALTRIQTDAEKFNDFRTSVVPSPGDNYTQLRVYAGTDAYGNPYEQWHFYCNECTSWVAAKVNEMWGTYDTFKNGMYASGNLGNASNWLSALQQTFVANTTPQAGDIIWFQPLSPLSSDGHVGFVHEVSNGYIVYTDYNGDSNHYHAYQYRTVPVNNPGAEYSAGNYQGYVRFIHVQEAPW